MNKPLKIVILALVGLGVILLFNLNDFLTKSEIINEESTLLDRRMKEIRDNYDGEYNFKNDRYFGVKSHWGDITFSNIEMKVLDKWEDYFGIYYLRVPNDYCFSFIMKNHHKFNKIIVSPEGITTGKSIIKDIGGDISYFGAFNLCRAKYSNIAFYATQY